MMFPPLIIVHFMEMIMIMIRIKYIFTSKMKQLSYGELNARFCNYFEVCVAL